MAEERDERLGRALRIVAPGTPLREGLENILRARTGGLIVVGDTPPVLALLDGGFRIDAEFQPQYLYELAKMDGAIVLSHDARRILYANAMLIPDPSIPSTETGMRHRTAERVARQTGELTIAVSQRRNIISLYMGSLRYVLRDTGILLAKANQALQTLERYRAVLSQSLVNLSALELEDLATGSDVVLVFQRLATVLRIVREIERYTAELGAEGRLIGMQLEELVAGLHEEAQLLVRDYLQGDDGRVAEGVAEQIAAGVTDVSDSSAVARLLGIGPTLEVPITPRGYRLLRKIPRLPMPVIENLVRHFGSLPPILRASPDELDEVDGIGEARARAIRDGLRRLREQTMLERQA